VRVLIFHSFYFHPQTQKRVPMQMSDAEQGAAATEMDNKKASNFHVSCKASFLISQGHQKAIP